MDLNQAAGIHAEEWITVVGSVLPALYPVYRHCRRGESVRASDDLWSIWIHQAVLLGFFQDDESARSLQAASSARRSQERVAAFFGERTQVIDFQEVVAERLRQIENEINGQRILRRLMMSFALSQSETGRMFGVTGETIRRWEGRIVSVPAGKLAALVSADAALTRLLDMVRAEALPRAVRRPAPHFDDAPALNLILNGRIKEVAAEYERLLVYQA
ncbi:MAG: hypothetical protein ACR2PL_06920 [Dehalococcoidia bacterium]